MLKEYKDISMDIDKSDSLSHNNDGLSLFCVWSIYRKVDMCRQNMKGSHKEGLSMPTERFYRLSKEKADKIREAAIQELKRVPPEEVSINKIVQAADISRGSFYTYFADKDDLWKWVLGDFIEHYRQFYLTGLDENGGDLWDVFDRVLDNTIQWVSEQSLVEIVGNMMKGNRFAESLIHDPEEGSKLEEVNKTYTAMLHQKVSPQCVQVKPEEFRELMSMHVASLVMVLKAYFGDKAELNTIKASYQRQMKLLRYGACPRTEMEK